MTKAYRFERRIIGDRFTPEMTRIAMDLLTDKGTKIMSVMQSEYGPEKGKQVFYASKNAGKIKGVDQKSSCSGTCPEHCPH